MLSVVACDGTLTHASLIFGPRRMAEVSWPEWQLMHDIDPQLHSGGIPARFVATQGRWSIARSGLSQAAAKRWLGGALGGQTPVLGDIPSFSTQPGEPNPVLLARKHNKSPASSLVQASPRPVRGAYIPLSAPSESAPAEWPVGDAPHWLLILLGIDAPVAPMQPGRLDAFAPAGIVVGRVSRRAWIGRVTFRPEQGLRVELRRESGSDPDFHGLVLELVEGNGGELFDSRRLALADVRLPANAKSRVWVNMPTLGLGIQRTLRLYDRSGELLDQRDPFNFVESIRIDLQIDGSAARTITVGNVDGPPTLPQRLQAMDDVEAAWEAWRRQGLRYRVITDGRAMHRHLRTRLRRARSEVLVIDPYFGVGSPPDWAMVDGLRASVRVLTGSAATRPARRCPGRDRKEMGLCAAAVSRSNLALGRTCRTECRRIGQGAPRRKGISDR